MGNLIHLPLISALVSRLEKSKLVDLGIGGDYKLVLLVERAA